jgi:protocatechuate 3,4-dioxygenase beta subunit
VLYPNRSSALAIALAVMIGAIPSATPVGAQALYGTLTGTIQDAQGAAIPGATVSARHEQTGLEVTTVTDETGTYTIRNIAGGNYTLKASMQ